MAQDLHQVARLRSEGRLHALLEKIKVFQSKMETEHDMARLAGPIEHSDEYQLVVEATNMTTEIADEISIVHKFIRDHYAKKFPELESLVMNPVDYAHTVKRIGNETDLTVIDLSDIMAPATVMVVSVAASTTTGKPVDHEKLAGIIEACNELLALDENMTLILQFVESRMAYIAPNLSAVVGSSIAAKLMGVAGGLSALSKLPANTIQVLGPKRMIQTGFSTMSRAHAGFINDTDVVQTTPRSLQEKARRLISGKCTLAARVDAFQDTPGGEVGRRLRDEVEKKIEKWQEPPPPKAVKPLAAPDSAPKKRRGGKRVRKLKEQYQMTEMRRQANRMSFGVEAEATYGNASLGMGMLSSQGGNGRVRIAQADKNILKSNKRARLAGGTTTTTSQTFSGLKTPAGMPMDSGSGIATSLAFTPVQGIELNDPLAAQRRIREANERYFGSGSGFMQVGNKRKQPDMSTSSKVKLEVKRE
eukprot:TRINITY_DN6513_c0_g1_i2.p1 TRINITY_DN6513_c0_g1~~TRINITY_DN6513_c0_g1_i2.p1  ORF type:complete len:525 (-),score=100.12 TRINITY_DN6513_c0_g1_i2:44-1468(-)